MTDIDLDAIEARHRLAQRVAEATNALPDRLKNTAALEAVVMPVAESFTDIPALVAEVRSLQAHIDLMHETWTGAATVTRERDQAHAAGARVEALCERRKAEHAAQVNVADVEAAMRGDA